jgi:PHD/YefM family antitoxin component YafN of YafNO toxin-antitoxin module
MAETAYLLSTENNMKHLLASIDQVKTGHAFKKDKCPDQRDFEATFQR